MRHFEIFSRTQMALLGVVAVLIVLTPMAFVFSALPFEPYEIRGYENNSARSVCPEDAVRLAVTTRISKPLLGNASTLDVSTHWETPEGVSTPVVRYPQIPAPDYSETFQTYESRAVRAAPMQPGFWGVSSVITTHGHVLGIPRTQVVTFDSKPLLWVLPPTTAKCQES